MKVRDLMTTRVLTIDGRELIAQARARFREAGVHQLVVTGGRGRVVGVLGVADVHRAPDAGRVEDFMSRRLFIVSPDSSLGEAAALMRVHAIGCLPVVDGRRLVGIVTVSDMLDLIDDEDESLRSP